jgi:hypothetical protein
MTFPNHISLVTGLHPDRHGIVGNSFDPDLGRAYDVGPTTTGMELVSRRTGMGDGGTAGHGVCLLLLASSDAPIGGIRPHSGSRTTATFQIRIVSIPSSSGFDVRPTAGRT